MRVRCLGLWAFLSLLIMLINSQITHNGRIIQNRDNSIECVDSRATSPTFSKKVQQSELYKQLPLRIIKNQGQVDARVKFYTKSKGIDIFFTKKEIFIGLHRSKHHEMSLASRKSTLILPAQLDNPKTADSDIVSSIVHLKPLGIDNRLKIEPGEKLEGKVNYFTGKDPQKWRTDIPTYGAVVYQDAYPGIDLKFYGNERQIEYDVVVKPGGDPSLVKLQYSGIKALNITPEGDLAIKLPDGGEILQKKPLIYQEIAGMRVAREGKFKIHREIAEFVYGFEVASYDKNSPLIIDPVLVYSTYLGGSSDDSGNGIAVDKAGNIYVIGCTFSTDFPTANPLQALNKGSYDIIVTKINSAGSGLVYSTYLGGTDHDFGKGIAVDGNGNVYLTGYTYSTDFPTQGPIQSANKGIRDTFVAKLNTTGTTLIYSTYLGGSDGDAGEAIAIDHDANAYVTGHTYSTDFPTRGAIQSINKGDRDAYIAKLNADGSSLVYSTYLGGSGQDTGISIAIDLSRHAFITGNTTSSNFPTRNPLQKGYKEEGDVFLAKLNGSGSSLEYSTYLGGTGEDSVRAIALDRFGNVYLTGATYSNDFPTQNPLQAKRTASYGTAFITKINANGLGLVYSTYLGGGDDDSGTAIGVDEPGNVYIAGYTFSADFPTRNPLQSRKNANYDAIVAKLNVTGSALVYSTFLGGNGEDSATGIAVDKRGNVYVTGYTFSTDFPLKNALQPKSKFDYDAFVAKITENSNIAPIISLLLGN